MTTRNRHAYYAAYNKLSRAAIQAAIRHQPWRNLALLCSIRPRHFVRVGITGPPAIVVLRWLLHLHPAFSWNINRLFEGKETPPTVIDPRTIPLSKLPQLLTTLLSQPVMAEWEERIFRRGAVTPAHIAVRSLLFGFAHLIRGYSLGGAVVIAIGGIWYSYLYRRYGLEEAVLQHATQNLLASGAFILAVASANILPETPEK